MKFKSIALAAALLAATAAQAAILDLSSGGDTFSSALASETYEFTLPTDFTGNGSVTATFGFAAGYNISQVTFNGLNIAPVVIEPLPGLIFENYSLFSGPLTAGTYSFTIEGASIAGGSYTGQISVTAVPEPESLALVLAGLGVAGVLARRRSAK